MTSVLQNTIPLLRMEANAALGEFLNALEEVLEMGTRHLFRMGGTGVLATANEILIGPGGMAVAKTPVFIPFDQKLTMVDRVPTHFYMPDQPVSKYRRTAFGFSAGNEAMFGMIARDDEMEPGRHMRETLTDAMGELKKTASFEGRSPTVTTTYPNGRITITEGIMIDEVGFRSPACPHGCRWDRISSFQIDDRVRMRCDDATVEIA